MSDQFRDNDSPVIQIRTELSAQTEEEDQTSGLSQPYTIEDLPFELRHQILLLLDYEDARSLVRASPFFHGLYLRDRELHLKTYTHAFVAYRTWSTPAEKLKTRTDGIRLLTQYCKERRGQLGPRPFTKLTQDQTADIISFHVGVVRPLVQLYSQWAWSNMPVQQTSTKSWHHPTDNERLRLLRAFYRFQTCCNLFGGGRAFGGRFERPNLRFDEVDILLAVQGLFEPFEVEEIACVHKFVEDRFNMILDVAKAHISPSDQIYPAENLQDHSMYQDLIEVKSEGRFSFITGNVSAGLGLLQTTLRSAEDLQTLLHILKDNIHYSTTPFLHDALLGVRAEHRRRILWPSRGDTRQQNSDQISFQGDDFRNVKDVGPPMAWIMLWSGRYCDLSPYFVSDSIRRWGWVMWDQEVMRQPGLEEAMCRQWGEDRRGCDRRDPEHVLRHFDEGWWVG